MHRHPALVELSRDHHQALAVALRLRRATGESADAARAAFLAFWREGGETHFDIEEAVVLPALGDHRLCARIRAEHDAIRASATALAGGERSIATLSHVGEAMAAHVRLEERELFPLLQSELDDPTLDQLGLDVAAAHEAMQG